MGVPPLNVPLRPGPVTSPCSATLASAGWGGIQSPFRGFSPVPKCHDQMKKEMSTSSPKPASQTTQAESGLCPASCKHLSFWPRAAPWGMPSRADPHSKEHRAKQRTFPLDGSALPNVRKDNRRHHLFSECNFIISECDKRQDRFPIIL